MANRGWLLKGIAAVFVVAALFVPAASASEQAHRPARIKLSTVPLRKTQLGGVASSLSLAHDSGVVPNPRAGTLNPLLWTSSTETFFSLDSTFLQSRGWVGGYTLDYGDAFSGCSCVTEIRTSVQQFKTAAGAKKILGWFRTDDAAVLRSDPELGFAVAHRLLKVPPVGTSRFAYFTRYRTLRANPVQMVDERFTDGRYLLQVEIASGTTNSQAALASKLAKKLDRQLRLALTGRLAAVPVKLPAKLTVGPPARRPRSLDTRSPAVRPRAGHGDDAGWVLCSRSVRARPVGLPAQLRTGGEVRGAGTGDPVVQVGQRGGLPVDLRPSTLRRTLEAVHRRHADYLRQPGHHRPRRPSGGPHAHPW